VQSNWTAVVSRVVSQMQAITDIGNVFNRLKLVTDDDSANAIMDATLSTGEQKPRVWMVHLGAMKSKWAESSGTLDWKRTVVIEGFLAFEDSGASELVAMSLAESVIRALAADFRATKLGGTVLDAQPPELLNSEPRLFGFVLAHYIQISMVVQTVEQ
jgi:hypothetical protein